MPWNLFRRRFIGFDNPGKLVFFESFCDDVSAGNFACVRFLYKRIAAWCFWIIYLYVLILWASEWDEQKSFSSCHGQFLWIGGCFLRGAARCVILPVFSRRSARCAEPFRFRVARTFWYKKNEKLSGWVAPEWIYLDETFFRARAWSICATRVRISLAWLTPVIAGFFSVRMSLAKMICPRFVRHMSVGRSYDRVGQFTLMNSTEPIFRN